MEEQGDVEVLESTFGVALKMLNGQRVELPSWTWRRLALAFSSQKGDDASTLYSLQQVISIMSDMVYSVSHPQRSPLFSFPERWTCHTPQCWDIQWYMVWYCHRNNLHALWHTLWHNWNHLKPKTVRTRPLSLHATNKLVNSLDAMKQSFKLHSQDHKEESTSRIGRDAKEQTSLRRNLQTCINSLDESTSMMWWT